MRLDRQAADNVAYAAGVVGASRLVYFSGIVPDLPDDELSDHLLSRLEVEEILATADCPVLTLRASMVVGAGSTSFEVMRQMSHRLGVVQTVPGVDGRLGHPAGRGRGRRVVPRRGARAARRDGTPRRRRPRPAQLRRAAEDVCRPRPAAARAGPRVAGSRRDGRARGRRPRRRAERHGAVAHPESRARHGRRARRRRRDRRAAGRTARRRGRGDPVARDTPGRRRARRTAPRSTATPRRRPWATRGGRGTGRSWPGCGQPPAAGSRGGPGEADPGPETTSTPPGRSCPSRAHPPLEPLHEDHPSSVGRQAFPVPLPASSRHSGTAVHLLPDISGIPPIRARIQGRSGSNWGSIPVAGDGPRV